MNHKKIKNRIIGDSILNIIASIILTFTTQLIIYPLLADEYSAGEYGLILTIMGLINAIGVSIGNTLNNTRLLLQKEYDKIENTGDFNLIFLITNFLGSILLYSVIKMFFSQSFPDIIMLIILMLLVSFRAYYSVQFRIIINFKKIFWSNIVTAIGYMLGIIISRYTNNWIFIFLTGEIFALIYLFHTVPLIRETYATTNLFKITFSKFNFLFSATLVSSLLTYMDRFLIHPLLGPAQVSVYTIAAFLGKSAAIIITPISGVQLTYYAKQDRLSIQSFYKQIILFIIGGVFLYIAILISGPMILNLLYPSLAQSALPYLKITTIVGIIQIIISLISPILLRYSHHKWQLIIQSFYLMIYLVCTYIGMVKSSLLGFCIGALIAGLFRLIFMMFVIIKSLRKDQVVE